MEEFVFEATRDRLILPAENGGTVRLSKGNVVRGKFWLRYVGKGLKRKLEPSAIGKSEAQKNVAKKVQEGKAPKEKEIPKEAPKPEPAKEELVEEPEEAPPEEEEDDDSLPKSKKELRGKKVDELKDMAKDLGLKTSGGKEALVERLAEELGL